MFDILYCGFDEDCASEVERSFKSYYNPNDELDPSLFYTERPYFEYYLDNL